MLRKIISGGQTGADQAALNAAIKYNVPHGGWIQKGRKTEDGILPYEYKLKELKSGAHPKYRMKIVMSIRQLAYVTSISLEQILIFGPIIKSENTIPIGSSYIDSMFDSCLEASKNKTPNISRFTNRTFNDTN